MTDLSARITAGTLAALAGLALVFDTPSAVRSACVIAFALVAPGLAATRFVPTENRFDRLAMSGAFSLSLIILVSLLLVALDRWSGNLAFAELACLTAAFVAFPLPRQGSRSELPARGAGSDESGVDPQSTDTKRLADVHRKARSADPIARRAGLVELAYILEGQGETEWAAELRTLADEVIQPH